MSPETLIANIIALGASAVRQGNTPAAITTAYATLKELLTERYPVLNLGGLERLPESANKRGSLAEDLADCAAATDNDVIDAAFLLLQTVMSQTPAVAETIGVDLRQIKAAGLTIRDVQSSQVAVRIQNGKFKQDVTLTEIGTTAGSGKTGALTTHLAHVQVGGNLTIAYGGEFKDVEAAAQHYLQELSDECNLLPWRVVNPNFADPDKSSNLSLADIYTALDTNELRQVEREEELRQFMLRLHEMERVAAQEQADQAPRLLLMGDPGSGKSTFVKHLAYTLAQANLRADPAEVLATLDPWSHGVLVPVRIELRQVAAFANQQKRTLGEAQLLFDYLKSQLEAWDVADFWSPLKRMIGNKEARVLFLLDGLDEVATNQRQQIVDMVNDLCERHKAQRYLVTCRPYAYVGQPWKLVDFRQTTLAPFSQPQIDRFVQNWYDRFARRERFDASERRGELQRALRRPDLRQLAERPLLLTVMAQLHTFTGRLPDDRVQLYADAVNLLMQRWETRSGQQQNLLEQLALPNLKLSVLEAGLAHVAYLAHSQQQGESSEQATADIGEAELRGWLAPYLAGDWNKAGLFIDYIRERAGLLIRHKTAAYTFPHRSFQEYLAACHLTTLADFPNEATRLVQESIDRWREVFLLAVGRAPLGQGIAAINALCPQQVYPASDARTWQRVLLAGEALLEIGRIRAEQQEAGKVLLERLRGWLVAALRQDELLPAQRRAHAGRILARLGDPRPEVMTVDGMEFCFVPAGAFWMGSGDDDSQAKDDEKPQHLLDIPYNYWIARYPVSNAQFDEFVADGGYDRAEYWIEAAAEGYLQEGAVTGYTATWNEEKKEWEYPKETRPGPHRSTSPFNLPNHPRVEITWHEALAFTRWLTQRLHAADLLPKEWMVYLPSEAEWEKAARGGLEIPAEPLVFPISRCVIDRQGDASMSNTSTFVTAPTIPLTPHPTPLQRYPWGDELAVNRLNFTDSAIESTSSLGAFAGGVSPLGAEELSGNIFEWQRSLWGTKAENPDFAYPYVMADGREQIDADVYTARILRGGSWYGNSEWQRTSARDWNYPYHWSNSLGFRCVVVPSSR